MLASSFTAAYLVLRMSMWLSVDPMYPSGLVLRTGHCSSDIWRIPVTVTTGGIFFVARTAFAGAQDSVSASVKKDVPVDVRCQRWLVYKSVYDGSGLLK